MLGLLEEGFGGDGEKFGVVGGSVVVEDGAVPFGGFLDLDVVFAGEYVGPGGEGGSVLEDWDAVGDSVFLVELVGELVEGDVVAVVDVDGSAFG
nr:hypothetical protein [Pelagicoccus mobilis]